MENNSTYYIDLISRYFSNESTGSENEILVEWLKSDPENLNLFKEYQKTWELFEKARIEKQIDVDAEWEKLAGKIQETQETRVIHQQSGSADRQHGKRIRQKFINRTLHLNYQRIIKMAAVILLIAVPAFLLLRYLMQSESTKLNASSGIIERKLADGTSVTLNMGSILEYPSRFNGVTREVILTGEAWFEVAHDKTKPFIISYGKARIQVLGTSFYVNTKNANGNIDVILTKGKVALYYNDRPSVQVLLAPGEKAEILNEQEMISKSSNDNENFLSWKTKIFVFNDEPLGEIIQALNKVYHANIKVTNNTISNCRITVTFDNQSLESILNVLKSTVNLTIRYKGSEIEISGDGCR
jgi:ferric-dicitrate binding protein FerR (iron transport regulator)